MFLPHVIYTSPELLCQKIFPEKVICGKYRPKSQKKCLYAPPNCLKMSTPIFFGLDTFLLILLAENHDTWCLFFPAILLYQAFVIVGYAYQSLMCRNDTKNEIWPTNIFRTNHLQSFLRCHNTLTTPYDTYMSYFLLC